MKTEEEVIRLVLLGQQNTIRLIYMWYDVYHYYRIAFHVHTYFRSFGSEVPYPARKVNLL